MRPVIYVHGQLLKASTKTVNALGYVDKVKSITKHEMRKLLKAIHKDILDALGTPTNLDHQDDDKRTKEEKIEPKMPKEYYSSTEGFDLPEGFE